jgi:hypothetical protein
MCRNTAVKQFAMQERNCYITENLDSITIHKCYLKYFSILRIFNKLQGQITSDYLVRLVSRQRFVSAVNENERQQGVRKSK